MTRRLRTHVHVTGPTGDVHVFGPDSAVPEWAAARVTNPKAWSEEEPASEQPPNPVVEAAEEPAVEAADAEEPPRRGPGSSGEHWVAYARQLGVEVDGGAKRDEVIDLLSERGLIERD